MLAALPPLARFGRFASLAVVSAALVGALPLRSASAQEVAPLSPAPVTQGAPVVDTSAAASSLPLSGPIRKLDVLRVVVSGTNFGGDVRVDSDGTIALPRLGQIVVAQKKTADAARAIAARAEQRKLLQQADVAVYIIARKPEEVSINGAVGTQGRQPLREDMVLSDLIETAVPQAGADLSRVFITRRVEAKAGTDAPTTTEIVVDYQQYRTGASREAAYNPPLKDGDRVFVQLFTPATQGTVRVTGEVKESSKPVVSIAQGDTAVQVIQALGGLTEYANRDNIVVRRTDGDGKEEQIPVPYDLIVRGDRSKDVTLRRGDVIIVSRAERLRQVTVTGAVRDARPIPYRTGITLQEAISSAGGIIDGAREKDIEISRQDDGKLRKTKYNLTKASDAATVLQDGDSVFVPFPRRRQGVDAGTAIGAVSSLAFLLSVIRR